MKENKNSVTYDAATEELTVTTYYEKEPYLDTNLRRAYYLDTKYILTSKESTAKKLHDRRLFRILQIAFIFIVFCHALALAFDFFIPIKYGLSNAFGSLLFGLLLSFSSD